MELFESGEGCVQMPPRQDFFLDERKKAPSAPKQNVRKSGRGMSVYEKRLRKAALKKAGVSIHKMSSAVDWGRMKPSEEEAPARNEQKKPRSDPLFDLEEMNFMEASRQYYDLHSMRRTPMPLRLPTYVDTKTKVYSFLEQSPDLRSPRRSSATSPSRRFSDASSMSPKSLDGFGTPKGKRTRLNSIAKQSSESGSVLRAAVGSDDEDAQEPETTLPPEEKLYEAFVRFVASQLKAKIGIKSRLQRLSEDRVDTYASKYKGLNIGMSGRFGGQEREFRTMRERAEADRKGKRANVEHQVQWYRKMLEHVAKSENTIAPAQHHIILTVKHYLEMGEPFKKDIFYRLVPSLTLQEMKNAENVKLLIRLASYIGIEPEDFHTFLIKKSMYIPPDLVEVIAERVASRTRSTTRRQSKFTFVPFAATRWKRKSLRARSIKANVSEDTTIIQTSEGPDDVTLMTPPSTRRNSRMMRFNSVDRNEGRRAADLSFDVRRTRTTSDDHIMKTKSGRRVTFKG